MGDKLNERLLNKNQNGLTIFKIRVHSSVAYFIAVVLIFDGGYQITSANAEDYGWKLWLIIPLHLIFMYCIIATIHFLALSIVRIRRSMKNLDEMAFTYMLGFWFFPIGIWFIQPKVIEILNDTTIKEDPFSLRVPIRRQRRKVYR